MNERTPLRRFNKRSSERRWLDPASPTPTFLFLGLLILLALTLARGPGMLKQQRNTEAPVPLDSQSQLELPDGELKLTAADQSQDATELSLVMRILERIRRDTELSPQARQAVVVSNGEALTLRGTVGHEREREIIEQHARAVTGLRVNNELLVN